MPKVEKIGANKYRYLCPCGTVMTLETDAPPKKLYKCFECQVKLEEVHHAVPKLRKPEI